MRISATRGCAGALPLLAVFACMALPTALHAQQKTSISFAEAGLTRVQERLPAPAFLPGPALLQDPQEPTRAEQMTTSGFFLGIVGMLAGAAVGSGVGSAHCGGDCISRYAAGGASIAGALLIPVGVRIANDDDHNPLISYAASLATGAALWAGFNQIPGRPVALSPFVSAPLQVWLVSKLETR